MINWKNRIQKNGTIDLQGIPQHAVDYNSKCKKLTIFEDYLFTFPIEPPDNECINHGLSLDDQIFRKVYIPNNLAKWKDADKDYFIDAEWHRRLNGVWIYIKGKKYYIPGPFYFFLNYWTSMTTDTLIFRYTDLEFFWMWMLCVMDENCLGLISFKCRQIGETEKVLCIIYEYITRSRNAKAGMQSINEDDIKKTYTRLVHGHGEMIFYMKATHRGSSDPADGLFFDYQKETLNKEKMKENQKKHGTANVTFDEYMYPPLNSSIEHGPTKPNVFGTGTYRRYYMDEFGKFDRFSPLSIWSVVREAMYSRILNKVLGKALFTSTAEELTSGESLKWAKTFWSQSNFNKRTGNNQTLSGLYRIFRSAIDGAHTDKWGFPLKEQARETIKNTVAAYMSTGDMKGLIEYKRKNPITIDDVFSSANSGSSFDIDKLHNRLFYLESYEDIEKKPKPWTRGNFRWMDDKRESGIVVWEPNSKGRWLVSKHPKDFNLETNAKIPGTFLPKPANTNYFCCGVDPYEQKHTTTGDISLGGIAVKRKLDSYIDGGEEKYYQFSDETRGINAGDPVNNGEYFQTNRYVCTYLYRQHDPDDFYEDLIMTCVYYGTDFLPEKNKAGGLLTYLANRKHNLYLMERPNLSRNADGKSERDGITASEKTIDEYFGHLMTLSAKWANTIDHPDILEQLLSMNWGNRGEKDLGVAVGWCEYASKIPNFWRPKTQEQIKSKYFEENWV